MRVVVSFLIVSLFCRRRRRIFHWKGNMEYKEYAGFLYGLLFWAFIPPIATRILLSLYYRGSGRRRPATGSKEYERHYFRAFLVVIIGYFAYSLGEYTRENYGKSLYDVIGIGRIDVPDRLSTHFKQRIIELHPDKNPNNREGNQEAFLRTKQAYEILNIANLRAAYDVYGLEAIRSTQQTNAVARGRHLGDYFWSSFYELITFVLVTSTLTFLSALMGGGRGTGAFWRFLGLSFVAAIEMHILMRPLAYGVAPLASTVHWYSRWWSNLPIYFRLGLVRRTFIFGCLAIDQIIGQQRKHAKTREKEITDQAVAISQLLRNGLVKECDYQVQAYLEPVQDNEEMRDLLQRKMAQISLNLRLLENLPPEEQQLLINKLREK